MNNLQLVLHFFIQLAVILVFCRLVGAVAARLGQPQVVAEMLAGVLLGPSLFGLFWPQAQSWLFPWDSTQHTRDTQSYLFPASQLGLALYMFGIGMELRIDIVRRTLRSASQSRSPALWSRCYSARPWPGYFSTTPACFRRKHHSSARCFSWERQCA